MPHFLVVIVFLAVVHTHLAHVVPAPLMDRKIAIQTRAAEACCGDLGCFNSGGVFFHLLNRPINSVPTCSLISKLVFHLNTRQNPITTQILDPYNSTTISSSNFDASKATKILIHGFLDHWRWPWWTASVRELLVSDDYNIIRLDWSHGNTPPYTQASANARLVGAYVAKLVVHLKDNYQANPDSFHVIGHSLGAQAAGYVGESLRRQGSTLGRITGLDPAGPYFTYMPEEVRLDPSDAKVVDTIVTDGEPMINLGVTLAFGSSQPMGHLNFYPNGGLDQPGCNDGIISTLWNGVTMNATEFDTLGSLAATGLEVIACSHARAVILFYESINNNACVMKSFECESYEKFLKGECFRCAGGKCAVLGYHADPSLAEPDKAKKFYTITMARTPFCTNPHKVTFKLQPKTKENNARSQDGWIYVTLYGAIATSNRIQLNIDSMKLEPNKTYTFFFETPEDLGVIQSVIFYWEADTFLLNPLDWVRTNYLHLEAEIQLTEIDELVSVFQLGRTKIEEKKDTLAALIHSYIQKV